MMEIENTPTATCELICEAIANNEELGLNRLLAVQVFTLWLISPLLELQMKPDSKPYEVKENWYNLVKKYSKASNEKKKKDEPRLIYQRNLFYSRRLEEKIKDQKILELLYEETKYNILTGRYPTEIPHLIMLGGIQAREELGQYNPQIHTLQFFKEEQSKYLPYHISKNLSWSWLPISSKDSAEIRLLDQFKRIPSSATNRKLIRKYLEYCWTLPFYGSAFFEGQIEQPVRGLISYLTHQDLAILVAINERGLHIIDDTNCQLLLSLKYDEFNWDHTKPSRDDSADCMPCLFIQFATVENGIRVTKMLQVFSRQASLMDALINSHVINLRRMKLHNENDNKNVGEAQSGVGENESPIWWIHPKGGCTVGTYVFWDRIIISNNNNKPNNIFIYLLAKVPDAVGIKSIIPSMGFAQSLVIDGPSATSASNSIAAPFSTSPYAVLSNKLSKLTLATFDDNGRCIGQMGSWSIIN